MTDIKDDLKFLSSHEWARLEDGGIIAVGISDHAQDQLGDIVFVELPDIGKKFNQEDEVAVIESVKAASEIYCPMGGEVIELNNNLEDSPEIINTSPYDLGWFFKIKINDESEFKNLLSFEEYTKEIKE